MGEVHMQEWQSLLIILREHAQADLAKQMEGYMKNKFRFLGIQSPLRRSLSLPLLKEWGMYKLPIQVDFVRLLWDQEEREFQNVALDYLAKHVKQLEAEHIELLRELIISKSWWDTVDGIAIGLVGNLASRYPELIAQFLDPWSTDENMWLRRTAVLFQLHYKTRTDEQRLYEYIRLNAHSKEFFIQKAIGWALREYSKTNASSVRQFIQSHSLAKLSVREGSKYI
jgi:3-methyladenine DNA glycosylase AlkD